MEFSVVDYVLFSITLGVSASVGIYFGFFGTKQKTATEYLYGNRDMKAIPVGLSLYSSAISAVTIAGTPGEIYVFGTQHMVTALSSMISLGVTWFLVLPVFCGNLDISTPYEYLELRFNSSVRLMSSIIYTLHTLIFMPVVLYATTASFSEASGIPLVYCTTMVGGICVFYTMLGGFKSVIWTDAIQTTIMLCSCIFIMGFGFYNLGGFTNVWQQAEKGQRINFFNMDPNPFLRITFWSAFLGYAFNFASHSGCSAGSLQRYMSLPNEKAARTSTFIGAIGYSLIAIVTGLIGVCMYVYYQYCDPITSGKVSGANVIVQHFVTSLVGHLPGFTGFFVAGLLCAGLSTLSAELNTVSGVIYHDFILKIFDTKYRGELRGALIMKCAVFLNGLFYVIVAPMLANMTYLFQISQIVTGLTYGAKLGLIVLGTSFPQSNSIGVICGALISVLCMAWISIGAMYFGAGSSGKLPMSVVDCPLQNATSVIEAGHQLHKVSDNSVFLLYKLSHMHYTLLGTVITILVAIIVSYLTGANNVSKIDPKLLIPRFRKKVDNDPFEGKISVELKEMEN